MAEEHAMTKIELLHMLERDAREYRTDANNSLRRNSHMNREVMEDRNNISQKVIDAILVDYINFVGMKQGVDFALYTKDLD